MQEKEVKNMFLKISNYVKKRMALFLCGMAFLVIPLISQECQVIWYQSEEPEGLEDFLK